MDHKFPVFNAAAGEDHSIGEQSQKVAFALLRAVNAPHHRSRQLLFQPLCPAGAGFRVGQDQLFPLRQTVQDHHCRFGRQMEGEQTVAFVSAGRAVAESKGGVSVCPQLTCQNHSRRHGCRTAVEVEAVGNAVQNQQPCGGKQDACRPAGPSAQQQDAKIRRHKGQHGQRQTSDQVPAFLPERQFRMKGVVFAGNDGAGQGIIRDNKQGGRPVNIPRHQVMQMIKPAVIFLVMDGQARCRKILFQLLAEQFLLAVAPALAERCAVQHHRILQIHEVLLFRSDLVRQ